MGLFSRLKAKEERLYKDPETGKTEWLPVKQERHKREIKELTREEQFKPRQHPWQTPRGKRTIKKVKSGIKKIDDAVVNYNRRQPSRKRSSYSISDNYNPFGTMFDSGMDYSPPKKKKKSKSRTKSYSGFDIMDNWGFL